MRTARTPRILASVRPRKNRQGVPIIFSTGSKARSYSDAFQRAVEA